MFDKLKKKIICRIKGHDLRIVQKFNPGTRRIKCRRCGLDWGMNDNVQAVIDWCPELEDMYEVMGFVIKEPKFHEQSK